MSDLVKVSNDTICVAALERELGAVSLNIQHLMVTIAELEQRLAAEKQKRDAIIQTIKLFVNK